MKQKFKVITDFGLTDLHIEVFDTMEAAVRVFNQSIKDEAFFVYLLETHITYTSGGSFEKIVSFFKR